MDTRSIDCDTLRSLSLEGGPDTPPPVPMLSWLGWMACRPSTPESKPVRLNWPELMGISIMVASVTTQCLVSPVLLGHFSVLVVRL